MAKARGELTIANWLILPGSAVFEALYYTASDCATAKSGRVRVRPTVSVGENTALRD
jgi:hypothetical protein